MSDSFMVSRAAMASFKMGMAYRQHTARKLNTNVHAMGGLTKSDPAFC
jgi:hypothetical protein